MDFYRRYSNTTPSTSANLATIPPAPPLPPERTASGQTSTPATTSSTAAVGGRSAGFWDRLLYGSRRANNPVAHDQEFKNQFLLSQNYGHGKSQSTSHRTSLRIRALDVNQSRSHVVLAGGKILKTVRVDHANCTEDFNIRDATINNAWKAASDSTHRGTQYASFETENAQRETFDIEDVAWSGAPFARHIATAASNGKIMLYDLDRPGVEVGRLHEHYRQVHKVDFNPIEGGFLLSGSQDGTVRLWDLREFRRNVTTFYSKDTFPGRSDGVRHTKWSRTCTWDFALGTDNGTVQRWDTRQNKSPVLKVAAHSGTCNSIDWHPDGKHLVSAGRDKTVKVWNLWANRKQTPAFQLRAPKEIQNVRWRPSCYVPGAPDQHVKQCTHLATSYRYYPMVHVWDLRRPVLPFKEFYHGVNSGTTDMLWNSKDLLWTVGPEGEFNQTDIRYAIRALDRRPLQALSWAPNGELDFFVQKRPARSRVEIGLNTDEDTTTKQESSGSVGSDASTLVKAYGDDSVDENFLSTSVPKRHSRSTSFKTSRSLGSTPPSYDDFMRPTAQLDQVMRQPGSLAPEQQSKYGEFPFNDLDSVFDVQAQVLFGKDIECLEVDSSEKDPHSLFRKYARCAKLAGNPCDYDSIMLLDGRMSDALGDMPSDESVRETMRPSTTPDFERSKKPSDELRRPSSKGKLGVLPHEETVDSLNSSNVTPIARPLSNHEEDTSIDSTPPLDLILGAIDENEAKRFPSSDKAAQVRPPMRRDSLSSDDGLPFHMSRRVSFDSVQMFSQSSESQSKPSAFNSFTSKGTSETAGSSVEPGELPGEKKSSTPEDVTMNNASSETLKWSGGPRDGQARELSRTSNTVNGDTPIRNTTATTEHSRQHSRSREPFRTEHVGSSPKINQKEQASQSFNNLSSSPALVDSDAPALALRTLKELLNWWTSQSDVQTASHIYFAAAPIIGKLASVVVKPGPRKDTSDDSAMHEYLTSTHSFTPSAAESIIKHYHEPLTAVGLSSAWIEAILLEYHQQLSALCLFQEAASLRRLACPAFPDVYDQGIGDFETYTMCPSCRGPVEASTAADKLRCDKCDSVQPDCPFCWQQRSPFDMFSVAEVTSSVLSDERHGNNRTDQHEQPHITALWTACTLCNHSAHAACALKWFSDISSDGICPHEECYCACEPGAYQDELIAATKAKQQRQEQQRRGVGPKRSSGTVGALDGEAGNPPSVRGGAEDEFDVGLKTGMGVRQDDWEVSESSAVRRVSGALRRQDQRATSGPSLGYDIPSSDGGTARNSPVPKTGLSGDRASISLSAEPSTGQLPLKNQPQTQSSQPQKPASRWWPRSTRGSVSGTGSGNVASSSPPTAKSALNINTTTGSLEDAAAAPPPFAVEGSTGSRAETRRHGQRRSLDGARARGTGSGSDAQQRQTGQGRGEEQQTRTKGWLR